MDIYYEELRHFYVRPDPVIPDPVWKLSTFGDHARAPSAVSDVFMTNMCLCMIFVQAIVGVPSQACHGVSEGSAFSALV